MGYGLPRANGGVSISFNLFRLRKEMATKKSNPSRCAVQTGSGRGVVTLKDNNYLQQ